jgi:hypothetical protein
MRTLLLISVLAGLGVAKQMTGYISDAACGWNNARSSKEAKECAQKCVKVGWDPVFVLDGQMESFKVSDKAKVMPYVGDHVIVVGQLKGTTLSVESIRRSSRGSATKSKKR